MPDYASLAGTTQKASNIASATKQTSCAQPASQLGGLRLPLFRTIHSTMQFEHVATSDSFLRRIHSTMQCQHVLQLLAASEDASFSYMRAQVPRTAVS